MVLRTKSCSVTVAPLDRMTGATLSELYFFKSYLPIKNRNMQLIMRPEDLIPVLRFQRESLHDLIV